MERLDAAVVDAVVELVAPVAVAEPVLAVLVVAQVAV